METLAISLVTVFMASVAFVTPLEQDFQCDDTWMNKDGLSCERFGENKWCKKDGDHYGSCWRTDWGTFEDFPDSKGRTALVCSQCGCEPEFYKEWMTRDGSFHKYYHANGIEVTKTPGSRMEGYTAMKDIVQKMLKNIPDQVWNNLVWNKARTGLFSNSETTCYYPEYASNRDTDACRRQQQDRQDCNRDCRGTCTSDGRKFCAATFGLGGIRATINEENILCTDLDPYLKQQNIFVHEFSHTIANSGLPSQQRTAVSEAYRNARRYGIWTSSYAMSSDNEYWAEASGVWFGVNKGSASGGMNGSPGARCPNEAACRQHLLSRDPMLATILRSTYSPANQTSGLTICPSGCANMYADACNRAASKGWCKNKREIMKRECPKLCGLCTDLQLQHQLQLQPDEYQPPTAATTTTTTTSYICKDSGAVSCRGYVRAGYCEGQYEEWMILNCVKSCGKCGSARKDSKYEGCGSDSVYKTCLDKDQSCTSWAEEGYCERSSDYMTANCPNACGRCGISNAANGA